MNGLPFLRLLFVVCVWFAEPSTVRAAPTSSAAVVSVTLADSDGWGVRKLMGGLNSRTRIVQIAIACMCLGLFILMRKMNA